MVGKVALVTGASRGIGKAIALTLAKQGADIALVYAGNKEAAEKTAEEIRALGRKVCAYQCDVADDAAVGEMMKNITKDLGNVYVLVNNAGITKDNLAIKMKAEDFSRVLDVNLSGAFHCIRHLYSSFLRQRGGRIINITSVAGIMGNAGQANYSAAKAGMIGLTKSIAKELAGRGITCNAIAPGMIETEMTDAMTDGAKESMISAIPMKRQGNVEEIAQVVAFLASEQASYITGTVIPVDGGLSM